VRTVILMCYAVGGALLPAALAKPKDVRSFTIPGWTFDRGSASARENPHMNADYRDIYPELVAGDGGRVPWFVEYDVDFPADGTYALRIRYAAAEPRPVELRVDGRLVGVCCREATAHTRPHAHSTPNPYYTARQGRPVRNEPRWTDAGKLTVTKGKHTLRFTRNGPGPNLCHLKLTAPTEFPKGWKPDLPGMPPLRRGKKPDEEDAYPWPSAAHMAKINRLPPKYRAAFLPPGSVNTATLRPAVKATLARFGTSYPKGPQYLKELDTLAGRQTDALDGPAEQSRKIDRELAALRHRAMMDHPLLDFDELLFVKRTTYTSSHIYSDHWDGSRHMGGNLCILSPVAPDGKVRQLVPELNGGLFGRFDLSFDGKKVLFSYKRSKDEGYRLYEVDTDGRNLRQLTFDDPREQDLKTQNGWPYRFEDCDPCYLPNGKIMFASTRSQRRVFCFGSTVTSLYVMDLPAGQAGADGGNMTCVSAGTINEMSPAVMDDGRVLYTRWEYVDKGFGNVQSLWSIRPDGSHSMHVYKNDIVLPAGMINARSIPHSRRIVTVGVPHCGLSVGPVILVDNRLDRRSPVSMENITPEIPFPAMFAHPTSQIYGYFKAPWPLSERLFLVSYSPGPRPTEPKGYGLYLLDAWGNKTEVYRDPETSCFQPTPLRARPKPTNVATVERDNTAEARQARLFMQDVYQGMRGIERGRVKYLRIMEAIGTSWDDGWRSSKQGDGAGLQASAVSLKCDVHIKKIHGITAVHEDGSAYFTVPAEKNLFFQALDGDFMELQRMKTFVNLMPGEKRSCIGCHERRQLAPGHATGRPMALDGPAAALRPQPGDAGPRTVHYALDVRPILDKHCVRCHGGDKPKGNLDLTAKLTKLYDVSYENLINKGLVANLNDGYGASNVVPEPPLTFGSHQSRLIARIRTAPCKAKLTRAEFIRLVTWVDANAPYFGTHRGKKNLKWKDAPDFRPLPPAGAD